METKKRHKHRRKKKIISQPTTKKQVMQPKAKLPKQGVIFDRKKWYLLIGALMTGVFLFNIFLFSFVVHKKPHAIAKPTKKYWFILHRKSNRELFYKGIPGDRTHSTLLKTFTVKTGIPGERPTPLPQLVGKKYWVIIAKEAELDNPETAPYFLTLNIPAPTSEPYGPSPYNECNGQCNWILPGAFGLHGTASDSSRLSVDNPGSSGCIRHKDEDIAYLYNTLDPKKEEIRYYVEDN